jgi:hypothetical protein
VRHMRTSGSSPESRKMTTLLLTLLLATAHDATAFNSKSTSGVHAPSASSRVRNVHVMQGSSEDGGSKTYWPPLSMASSRDASPATSQLAEAVKAFEAATDPTTESISPDDLSRLQQSKNDAAASLADAEAELSSVKFPLGSGDAAKSRVQKNEENPLLAMFDMMRGRAPPAPPAPAPIKMIKNVSAAIMTTSATFS